MLLLKATCCSSPVYVVAQFFVLLRGGALILQVLFRTYGVKQISTEHRRRRRQLTQISKKRGLGLTERHEPRAVVCREAIAAAVDCVALSRGCSPGAFRRCRRSTCCSVRCLLATLDVFGRSLSELGFRVVDWQ